VSKAATEVTACDREPIHLSGAIQPFGYLIAFNLSNFTVEFASKNVSEFLKIDLDSVLMMTESNFESCLKTVSTGHTHRFESGNHKVIEFEAAADETGTADRLLRETESITGAWSSVELFQRMSDATQRLTEFHRVMIYHRPGVSIASFFRAYWPCKSKRLWKSDALMQISLKLPSLMSLLQPVILSPHFPLIPIYCWIWCMQMVPV
jgi:light-regulated signal transduction histidine kinase (bacteriophytochrome)